MRAWSLYTISDTSYAGHEGYDDRVESHYSYDSAVPNHLQVSVGDLVVLRDDVGSLGIAFLEHVSERAGTKTRHRCPRCGTSQVDERATIVPRFRCTRGHEFDRPDDVAEPVTVYRAEYANTFLALRTLGADELESLCLARSRQNAIRELDLDRILEALRLCGIHPAFVRTS